MKRRVVITGSAIISSLGETWPDIFSALKACTNKIKFMPDWAEKYPRMNTALASPAPFVMPDYPRKKVRGLGRVGQLALVSADRALKAAGIAGDDPFLKSGRAGVAYGSSMGSVDPLMDFYSMLVNGDSTKLTATTYIKAMPQTCAANISVYFGCTGRIVTTNTACTSGAMAIGNAFELIRDGVQDLMIAGGADELSAVDAAIFDTLFAASSKNGTPSLTPRAFDINRDGLVIGEGGGTFILEDYDRAKERGAPIIAEVAGFGTNSDGVHITSPNRDTMAAVMKLALESAGLPPEAVGYVNAHGTATTAGDIAESQATSAVFGKRMPVSTIKNYTGHTLGAAGAIEAYCSINMMKEKWFCPNLNLTDLDPQCGALDYITGSGRALDTEFVMSNNFAFGGINTSLIFRNR